VAALSAGKASERAAPAPAIEPTAQSSGETGDKLAAFTTQDIDGRAVRVAGGPAALLLIRLGTSPVRAGLAVATAMKLVVDEAMNTVLKLTAPPQEWPWQAHARASSRTRCTGAALGLLLAARFDD